MTAIQLIWKQVCDYVQTKSPFTAAYLNDCYPVYLQDGELLVRFVEGTERSEMEIIDNPTTRKLIHEGLGLLGADAEVLFQEDTPPYEDQIDDIMECMDWENMEEVVKLAWKTHGLTDEYFEKLRPTAASMKKNALEMLQDAAKDNHDYYSHDESDLKVTKAFGWLTLDCIPFSVNAWLNMSDPDWYGWD